MSCGRLGLAGLSTWGLEGWNQGVSQAESLFGSYGEEFASSFTQVLLKIQFIAVV